MPVYAVALEFSITEMFRPVIEEVEELMMLWSANSSGKASQITGIGQAHMVMMLECIHAFGHMVCN